MKGKPVTDAVIGQVNIAATKQRIGRRKCSRVENRYCLNDLVLFYSPCRIRFSNQELISFPYQKYKSTHVEWDAL